MSSSIPGSPASRSNKNYSSKSDVRPEASFIDSVQPKIMEDLRHQIFQGQLYKFTNVVKGMIYEIVLYTKYDSP